MKNPLRKIRKIKKNIKNFKRSEKISKILRNEQSNDSEILKKIKKEKNIVYDKKIEDKQDNEIFVKINTEEKTYKMIIEDDEEESEENNEEESKDNEEEKNSKNSKNEKEENIIEEESENEIEVEEEESENEVEKQSENEIEVEEENEIEVEEENEIEVEEENEIEVEEEEEENEIEVEEQENGIEEEEEISKKEEIETSGAETIKEETDSESEPLPQTTPLTPKTLPKKKKFKNAQTSKPQKPSKKASLKLQKKKIKRTICIPDSILEKVQTIELQNHLIGQLARTLCMYKINEIIILKDHSYKKKFYDLNPSEYITKILQYLETPQYLRKRLFPISNTLRHVGLIMPLECCHHLQISDVFEYREGVVLKRPFKDDKGSWVDIGLRKDCKIGVKIQPSVRVTVKIEDFEKVNDEGFGNSHQRFGNKKFERGKKFFKGEVVSPNEVQQKTGFFWGYNVECAYTFSEVFKNLSKNCLKVLVDPESQRKFGEDVRTEIEDMSLEKNVEEIFLFFSGEGLKYLFDCDEATKIQFENLKNKFDFRFNPYYDIFGFNNIYVDEQVGYYSNEIFN